MIKPRYIVGFTGHRQIDDAQGLRAAVAIEIKSLKDNIEKEGGVLELYSSAAYGADTIACEEAEKLGVPVHLILPKSVIIIPNTGEVDQKSGFAADFWDVLDRGGKFLLSEWEAAFRLIQAAERGVNGGTIRLVTGTQTHPECYYDTGLQILESVDILIAVWDHQPARGLGGSQQLIHLAEANQLPRVIISANGGQTERIGLERLTKTDEKSRQIFESLEKFSLGCSVCNEEQDETSAQIFSRLEECSGKHSKYFRISLVLTILWHGCATLVAAIAAVLPQSSIEWKYVLATLAALELFLVSKAFLRARRLHQDETHERWMETRFAAELMRAMKHSVGLLDPLHPLIARHQPHWRRFAVTAGLLIYRTEPRFTWDVARDKYVNDRLRHPNPEIGQITYFTQKQAAAEPYFKNTNWWGRNLGCAAIVFVIGALVCKIYVIIAKSLDEQLHLHLYYPHPINEDASDISSWIAAFCFSFLPIALPLAAGIFISLRIALDSGRRTYRYKELAESLSSTAATLETLKTEASVRRTVVATEEILLDELVEWYLAERQNGAH